MAILALLGAFCAIVCFIGYWIFVVGEHHRLETLREYREFLKTVPPSSGPGRRNSPGHQKMAEARRKREVAGDIHWIPEDLTASDRGGVALSGSGLPMLEGMIGFDPTESSYFDQHGFPRSDAAPVCVLAQDHATNALGSGFESQPVTEAFDPDSYSHMIEHQEHLAREMGILDDSMGSVLSDSDSHPGFEDDPFGIH